MMTNRIEFDPDSITISLVSISDEMMEKVAERTGLTKEDIQKYLKSDQQDGDIFGAFAFYGVHPVNKGFGT